MKPMAIFVMGSLASLIAYVVENRCFMFMGSFAMGLPDPALVSASGRRSRNVLHLALGPARNPPQCFQAKSKATLLLAELAPAGPARLITVNQVAINCQLNSCLFLGVRQLAAASCLPQLAAASGWRKRSRDQTTISQRPVSACKAAASCRTPRLARRLPPSLPPNPVRSYFWCGGSWHIARPGESIFSESMWRALVPGSIVPVA
jgi:hypothetical protein